MLKMVNDRIVCGKTIVEADEGADRGADRGAELIGELMRDLMRELMGELMGILMAGLPLFVCVRGWSLPLYV